MKSIFAMLQWGSTSLTYIGSPRQLGQTIEADSISWCWTQAGISGLPYGGSGHLALKPKITAIAYDNRSLSTLPKTRRTMRYLRELWLNLHSCPVGGPDC